MNETQRDLWKAALEYIYSQRLDTDYRIKYPNKAICSDMYMKTSRDFVDRVGAEVPFQVEHSALVRQHVLPYLNRTMGSVVTGDFLRDPNNGAHFALNLWHALSHVQQHGQTLPEVSSCSTTA
jgi:hypothetical protein